MKVDHLRRKKMKALLAAAILLTTASTAHSVEPAFRFSGEVVVDHQTPLAYGVAVQEKRGQSIDVPSGLKLEITAGRTGGEQAETQTRLLRPIGNGQFVVLHQAQTTGSADIDRSITYRVCGDVVTFMTPAPSISPKCAGGL